MHFEAAVCTGGLESLGICSSSLTTCNLGAVYSQTFYSNLKEQNTAAAGGMGQLARHVNAKQVVDDSE